MVYHKAAYWPYTFRHLYKWYARICWLNYIPFRRWHQDIYGNKESERRGKITKWSGWATKIVRHLAIKVPSKQTQSVSNRKMAEKEAKN